MYYPKIYQKFIERFPDLFESFEALGHQCRSAGPIPEKYQNLIKLGIAIGGDSRGAVMSGTRKALQSGASPEEIFHTVLLSLTTTGFPNMMGAMALVDEVIQTASIDGREKDR